MFFFLANIVENFLNMCGLDVLSNEFLVFKDFEGFENKAAIFKLDFRSYKILQVQKFIIKNSIAVLISKFRHL